MSSDLGTSENVENGAGDDTDEKEIRIPSRIANLIRSAHQGKPESKTIVIDRAWFDGLVSNRTRSNEDDRVEYLRRIIGEIAPDKDGNVVIPALNFATDTSCPFPQSAYTNASYWSGAASAGALTAYRAGSWAASLKMQVQGGALIPTVTLVKMTDAESAEFERKIVEIEAKAKAAAEKAKAKGTDTATA